ncbi:MAG TPA: transglycosylase domain-containing protein [Thermoanaerobaculia bacterium]
MRRLAGRALLIAAATAVVLAVAGAGIVWAVVRHDVGYLRAAHAHSRPVAAPVAAALLAIDPALLDVRRLSLGAVYRSLRQHRRGCGPTLALRVIRSGSPRARRRTRLEAELATAFVTHAFTPDELLRIYAHDVYFGKVNGVEVHGLEAASGAYLRKASHDLAPAEAALLVGMLPYPNAFSPFVHPTRALARRNWVLTEMHRRGYLDDRQLRAAIAAPLPR